MSYYNKLPPFLYSGSATGSKPWSRSRSGSGSLSRSGTWSGAKYMYWSFPGSGPTCHEIVYNSSTGKNNK